VAPSIVPVRFRLFFFRIDLETLPVFRPDAGEFADTFWETPQQALETIDRGYKLGYHKAAKMAEIGTWAQMWGVTDLDDKDMDAIFIQPFHDLQRALDQALEKKGAHAKVLFLMDGSITVPMLK